MSDEFKLQWSVSLPPVAQYAKGHMMNFRANTAEELVEIFDAVLAAEVVDKALAVAELFQAGQVVHAPEQPAAVQAVPAAAASVTPISSNVKTCAHGVRTRRDGVKNGRAWVGYFCPTPKGAPDQCDPIFGD